MNRPSLKNQILAVESEHTKAEPTTDPIIGICFDADRLNLWRVGTEPDTYYLSTAEGCRQALQHTTRHQHNTLLSWADVLDELFANV